MNLAKAIKGEVYHELQNNDLTASCQTKGIGAKKSWLTSFTRSHLPIDRLQGNENDLSSKFESIQCKRKRKNGKHTTDIPDKLQKLMKLKKERCKKISIPAGITFKTFEPLCEMWTKYIEDLIQFSSLKDSSLPAAALKLMKADFHGCPIIVAQSKCPSYIGVQGIIIKETKNTFVLILKDDTIKCIPKVNSIFNVILQDHIFTIYGNQFTIKPGERAGKKFKSKPTIDLL
ncbi:RNase P/RNase MRP complex subunit [Bulinus truncatus]|nr:RNase P/RNase MRP complex subunit [Bulinus truncatus]